MVGDFSSKEPYSCMVPENDSKWRDFVNHTLMELIDSGKYRVEPSSVPYSFDKGRGW